MAKLVIEVTRAGSARRAIKAKKATTKSARQVSPDTLVCPVSADEKVKWATRESKETLLSYALPSMVAAPSTEKKVEWATPDKLVIQVRMVVLVFQVPRVSREMSADSARRELAVKEIRVCQDTQVCPACEALRESVAWWEIKESEARMVCLAFLDCLVVMVTMACLVFWVSLVIREILFNSIPSEDLRVESARLVTEVKLENGASSVSREIREFMAIMACLDIK